MLAFNSKTRVRCLIIIFFMMINLVKAQVSVSGNWTWMKGSDSGNVPGSYGQLGVADVSNEPRTRSGALNWMDNNGVAGYMVATPSVIFPMKGLR
jgi:hypothetical protein